MSSKLKIKASHQVLAQVEVAAEWWAQNRHDAPNAVHNDLAEILSLLCEHPGVGTPSNSYRIKGLRRVFLSRIRYYVYYRETGEVLEVLAFWHASRGQPPRIRPE